MIRLEGRFQPPSYFQTGGQESRCLREPYRSRQPCRPVPGPEILLQRSAEPESHRGEPGFQPLPFRTVRAEEYFQDSEKLPQCESRRSGSLTADRSEERRVGKECR